MKVILAAAALALVVLTGEPVRAQDYPNRPVTFVVPFAPGRRHHAVRPPAGAAAGAAPRQAVRGGEPSGRRRRDGGGGRRQRNARRPHHHDGVEHGAGDQRLGAQESPYDPRKDLTPIALLARVPFVLVVNPALPIHSVADLVKLAKEKPGSVAFGTPGPGTFHHLNAEMFKGIFGLDLVHVPYKGSAPALSDLAGGHIQMMFCDVPPALPLIQSGKVRALGVTTAERVKAVADIPPLAEAGIPGYDTASWHTVTTTAGVPQPIVDKLYGIIREAMQDPAVVDTLVNDGALPQVSPTPAEMKRFVESEIVRWGAVVEKAGLTGSQ